MPNNIEKNMPLPISACLIVKDEERFLERALRSIRPYVAQIVVLDTGSSDASIIIAKRYADVVGEAEWRGDFAAARNLCASLAAFDWIFNMDADEEVILFDAQNVWRAITENPRGLGRYTIRNIAESVEGETTAAVTRVYNRHLFHYEGTIHEMLEPIEPKTGRALFGIPAMLTHYGYLRDVSNEKKKALRNRELLLIELERNPDDAYYHYQLGKNYNASDEKDAACASFARALELDGDARKEYVADLVETYGSCLIILERYEKAAELLRYLEALPAPRNQFCFGMICMNNARYEDALDCFLRCIVKGSSVPVESCLPRYNLGVIFECIGSVDEAISMYSACGNFLPARARLKALRK